MGNVVNDYNTCRLTVYEMQNYILFCLYLAVILRNSVNNNFIKLVEQQLKNNEFFMTLFRIRTKF